MAFKTQFWVLLIAAGSFLPNLHAGPYDAIYAFGDSLSDVGNVYAATLGAEPAAPYYNGEFSNGLNWIQDFSIDLGIGPLTPSLIPGGTDYAYGGADTGVTTFNTALPQTDVLGATGQLAQFQLTHGTADPNALYVIWIGSNDLIDILQSSPTPGQAATDLGIVAGNIDTAVNDLAGIGAKNFLIVTVPDLGKSPALAGDSAAASTLAAGFDSALVPSLVGVAAADSIQISVLDAYSLLDSIVLDPAFTNSTDPCLPNAVNYAGGTPCANPNQYVFWDYLHPTAAADVLIADAALGVVPEPASVSLFAAGLIGLALMRRRYCGKR